MQKYTHLKNNQNIAFIILLTGVLGCIGVNHYFRNLENSDSKATRQDAESQVSIYGGTTSSRSTARMSSARQQETVGTAAPQLSRGNRYSQLSRGNSFSRTLRPSGGFSYARTRVGSSRSVRASYSTGRRGSGYVSSAYRQTTPAFGFSSRGASSFSSTRGLYTGSSATMQSYGGLSIGNGTSATSSRSYGSRATGMYSTSSLTYPTVSTPLIAYGSRSTSATATGGTTTAASPRRYGLGTSGDSWSRTPFADYAYQPQLFATTNSYAENTTSQSDYNSPMKVAGMYNAWREKYYEYYGYYPTDNNDLQAFIDFWLGEGLVAPTVEDGGSSTGGAGSIYSLWVDRFMDYYGRLPNDDKELQDFIDWWMGSGLFNPDDDDPSSSGGPGSLYAMWVERFYDYYGTYPADNDELQRFIDFWMAKNSGVFNGETPIGNGLWLLLLMAIAYTTARAIRRKRAKSNEQ